MNFEIIQISKELKLSYPKTDQQFPDQYHRLTNKKSASRNGKAIPNDMLYIKCGLFAYKQCTFSVILQSSIDYSYKIKHKAM